MFIIINCLELIHYNTKNQIKYILMSSQLGVTSMALVEYNQKATTGTSMPSAAGMQSPNTSKMLQETANVSAEEVGQLIHHLQEEIKIIKQQLENLPGYASGEVPPHLHKLKGELERIYDNLEKKNDLLMGAMMKNFGRTQQDLPNFKLPDIHQSGSKRAVAVDPFEDSLYPPKTVTGGTGILKQRTVRASYTAKRSLGGLYKNKKWRLMEKNPEAAAAMLEAANDPPPITEDDINKGMFNLLNKGIIPRDVDLTPAFEKGAAPVLCRGIKFYDKREQNVKREILTGPANIQNQFRFDLQPPALPEIPRTRALVPMSNALVPVSTGLTNLKLTQPMLALPAPMTDESRYPQPMNNSVSLEDASKFDQQARSYNELMDVFSLHQFIIRKGKVLDQTPEFISFKRTYIAQWGSVSYIIHLLEKFLSTYQIDLAYIDGKQLVSLADSQGQGAAQKPGNEQLFDCIANKDDVSKVIKIPSRMFKGPRGPELAAITIQKCWRMYKAHTAYSQLRFLMHKATIIQRRFRLFLFQKQTKAKVEEINHQSLMLWREMQEEFKEKWQDIKRRRRIEIHINSMSVQEMKRISMEKFLQRENAQIARLFAVRDPNVDVIYVSPFSLTSDVTGYYMKILEIGDIDNPTSRVNIVVPENTHKFPHHFSLAQMLIYSPKTMKRIRSLIKGRQSYIVPGTTPSNDDIKISIMLQVPIHCGEPSKQSLYSTKSGAKKIFQLADVPTPISAIDIYDEQEFMLQLAKLIANNLYVNTWIFKIDDEFNGRGHAYLYVDNVKALSEIRRKQVEINEELVDRIINILQKSLHRKVKLAVGRLYNGWQEYIQNFCRVGGVIEAAPTCMSAQMASPSICFQIEPDGEVTLIGAIDRFAGREYQNAGCMFPQQSLPNMNMMTISKSLGEVLYSKGIFGHVTVDLVSFPDPTAPQSHPLFWAVDLNCGLTDYATACFFFDFLMEGKLDQFTGKYTIDPLALSASNANKSFNANDSVSSEHSMGTKQSSKYSSANKAGKKHQHSTSLVGGREPKDHSEQRSFMYCRYLHHPGLANIQYKSFFHMCRLESISFDLERRSGATFMLQDCLQSGVIAMMTIAEDRKETLQMMVDAFRFLENQAGSVSRSKVGGGMTAMDEARTDEIEISDVMSTVRLQYKTMLKKEEKQKKTGSTTHFKK